MDVSKDDQGAACITRLRCLRARDHALARHREVAVTLENCRDSQEATAELMALLGVDEVGALSILQQPWSAVLIDRREELSDDIDRLERRLEGLCPGSDRSTPAPSPWPARAPGSIGTHGPGEHHVSCGSDD